MGLFDLFSKNRITLELTLPPSLRIEHLDDKIKFIGTKDEISKFAEEIRNVSRLSDGQLARAGDYVFKVSDQITEDTFRRGWIELPGDAWNVMAGKFLEVVHGQEDNPFYFSSCGYTNKTPLDIGVEVTD